MMAEDQLSEEEIQRVENVLRALTRPTFVWRMAGAQLSRKGSRTAYLRALADIKYALDAYAWGRDPMKREQVRINRQLDEYLRRSERDRASE